MARPKGVRFYEEELPRVLPPEHAWLEEYHANSRLLIEYLRQRDAKHYVMYSTLNCLTELRTYLLDSDKIYSHDAAEEWLSLEIPHRKTDPSVIERLADIYQYGEIQPINAFPRVSPYKTLLNEPWKSISLSFLSELSLGSQYIENKRSLINRFLYGMQSMGIDDPSEITFDALESYCANDAHGSPHSEGRYNAAIKDILLFMADKGLCIHGLGWYPYFRRTGRILRFSDLTDDQISTIESLRLESLSFPAEEYAVLIPDFLERFKSQGYSDSPCKIARYTLCNFLLFIEMHGLGYHKGIADIWLENEKKHHKGSGWKQVRRIINLFDLYVHEGDVIPQIIFRTKPMLCDQLPDWCRSELDEYLDLKLREGWQSATLDMIRASITRFCFFLEKSGLNSFSELTPHLLKSFNICDEHKSFEGKNAYNGRIRAFIKHLERKETVPYGLHQAMPGNATDSENIVITLTDEEREAIRDKYNGDLSATGLRDRAMILIGMKMGLRASDIVSIKLEDIDWEKQAIRIMQKKNSHEIIVPMPTEVGNAIYLYITHSRPNDKTKSRELFVKNRVPYDRLNRTACRSALKRALPNRNVPGSGFHVTRKTFATDSLRDGTGRQTLADLLGHRDITSLNHYLLLDEDRMRMCPLSLAETSLEMNGDRYETV